MMDEGKNKWMKVTYSIIKEVGLKVKDLYQISKKDLKTHMQKWDGKKWKEELLTKTTLSLYIVWKKEMKEVTFIDNQQASTIFFQARANCLPLNERKRYKKEDTRCMMCNAENEDLAHFILNCPAYEEERKESMHLQKPYERIF